MNSAIERFSSAGGDVFLNVSSNHQILREPSREEMGTLLREFRSRQLSWIKKHLLADNSDGDGLVGLGYSLLKASKNSRVKNADWRSINTHSIVLGNIPESAWEMLDNIDPLPGSAPATRIHNAPLDLKRRFFAEALGEDFPSIQNLLRPELRDVYIYPGLDEAYSIAASSAEFIQMVSELSNHERREMQKDRPSNFLRKALPDLFLLWLAANDILLFPISANPIIGDPRGFDLLLENPKTASLWADIEKAHEDRPQWAKGLRASFIRTTLASTIRSSSDLSLDMFERLFALTDEKLGESGSAKLQQIYRAIRDLSGNPSLAPFHPRRSFSAKSDDSLGWVFLSTKTAPRSAFPRLLPGDYDPKDNIIAWGERLSGILSRLQLKNAGNALQAFQHFLLWLLETGSDASHLDGISREDINDGMPLASSRCFRAFLHRRGLAPETSNAVISRLASAFDAIIEEENLRIPNPIMPRFDLFKLSAVRGKTARRALGRDLLSLIKEVNRRDSFALSKSISSHYRRMLGSDGRYEDIWFPAFAILADLLLTLPLRSIQARFLDSGEGDELEPFISPDGAQTRRNTLSTATKGRREGALYAFEGKGGSGIGIYVNTNKTAVDRVSGYEIPWCSDELRESILLMREWQIERNPIGAPIPCIERHDFSQLRNPDIEISLKTTYPLFRDPVEPGNWPITRDKFADYWNQLVAAAEDELIAAGRKVSLTIEKEVSKGPKKARVMKRMAAYDIHSLRVSGITALIEAGMPPDMVRQVAGHSTLVMTLYYNKINASSLNEKLSSALDSLHFNLESVGALEEADFARLSEFLINTRSPEDASGKAMLSERIGHGDGSVEVMLHGICPGGECSTGGEFTNQAVGYMPVPRPMACSLCRYRLTGPMFLPGLVLNANRLMHEMRRKGKEIADLNDKKALIEEQGKSPHLVKAQIEALYRETDTIGAEWAAETQYIQIAETMFRKYAEAGSGEGTPGVPTLITGLETAEIEARIDKRSEFSLLQSIAEGASVWKGFRPSVALEDHREFLNEILAANDAEPFLLRLRGDIRDQAAAMLGRAISALVPDEKIEDLRNGSLRLEEFPSVSGFLEAMRKAVASASIDEKAFAALAAPNAFPGDDQ